MRKLQWNKIPLNKVLGNQNVFTEVGDKYGRDYKLDFEAMEQLFSISDKSKKSTEGIDPGTPGEKKKKSDEVRH